MEHDLLQLIYTLNESSYSTLENLLIYFKKIYELNNIFYYSAVIKDDAYVLRGQSEQSKNECAIPVLYPCHHLHNAVENDRIVRIYDYLNECKDTIQCPLKSVSNFKTENICIILPIPFSREINKTFQDRKYCGVLILYAKKNMESIKDEELYKIARIFGELYCKSILYDKLKLREDIYSHAVKSPDINSYFHRLTELLVKNWNYEAISFFLNEERSKLIRLRKTTGLEQKYNKVTDVFYHSRENHLTVETAMKGTEHILINPHKNYTGKYSESVKTIKAACGIFPILLPPEKNFGTKKIVGVFRVINRLYKYDNKEIPTPFTWEDVIMSRFICEMSGMIFFLLEGSTQRTVTLERMTHGVLNYISSSIRSLTQINERSNYQSLVPDSLKYNISNTLGNLEAIEWQIAKYTTPPLTDKAKKIKKVNIFGDVLGEVVSSAEKVSLSMGIILKTSSLANAGFKEVPPIVGNATAIKLIFKNLFENAMKYRKGNTCYLTLSSKESESYLDIFISDKGIGINENEKEFIFYEGYRSDEAMAYNPTGTGFGLFQCLEWMDAMDGHINLDNPKNPTTFRLSFKKYKETEHDIHS